MELKIHNATVKIDKEDFELVNKYKWHLSSTGYAVWRGKVNGKTTTVRMHRLINNTPDGMVTDHINHDRLDNRKANLRAVTQAENMRNMRDQGRGYWKHSQNGNWVVEILGKHIGCFETETEAIQIADYVRKGGVYKKPERAHCRRGHRLDEVGYYMVANVKICKVCQSIRSAEYYKRKQGLLH